MTPEEHAAAAQALLRAEETGQQIGILALILLMSFAFYNDIARMFAQ